MTQNHYQWASERAITTLSPSKKETGMYEVSSLDHLTAKMDALFQKFDKLSEELHLSYRHVKFVELWVIHAN